MSRYLTHVQQVRVSALHRRTKARILSVWPNVQCIKTADLTTPLWYCGKSSQMPRDAIAIAQVWKGECLPIPCRNEPSVGRLSRRRAASLPSLYTYMCCVCIYIYIYIYVFIYLLIYLYDTIPKALFSLGAATNHHSAAWPDRRACCRVTMTM